MKSLIFLFTSMLCLSFVTLSTQSFAHDKVENDVIVAEQREIRKKRTNTGICVQEQYSVTQYEIVPIIE